MKKISKHLKDKLLLQAHEAQEQGLTKLSSAVIAGYVQVPFLAETNSFNHDELSELVQHSLWAAATQIAVYHDLSNVDIQKLEPLIAEAADKFINQIECSCDVEGKLGPFEETVPGQVSNT